MWKLIIIMASNLNTIDDHADESAKHGHSI